MTGRGHDTNNSELVGILLDIEQGANSNHARNPRRQRYWDAKMVNGPVAGVSTIDYMARDPWASAYMVTVDMNGDNKCMETTF